MKDNTKLRRALTIAYIILGISIGLFITTVLGSYYTNSKLDFSFYSKVIAQLLLALGMSFYAWDLNKRLKESK